MKTAEIHSTSVGIKAKIRDYNQLIKFRLTFTVVLSAVLGFLLGNEGAINYEHLTALILGGFLVVASSNGINQIIEKDYDKLMSRTANRPIAQNRMSILEAGIFCAVTGIIGVSILGLFLNTYAALLGFASLMSYAFIYTPLKRVSPMAVLVGAFPRCYSSPFGLGSGHRRVQSCSTEFVLTSVLLAIPSLLGHCMDT